MDIHHVDSQNWPELSPLLHKWVLLNLEMCHAWQAMGSFDVPWWYNERTSVSVLAGAVRDAGGFALEELSTRRMDEEDCAKRRRGRCDLYCHLDNREYSAEAKHIWSAGGSGCQPYRRINEALKTALNEVSRLDSTTLRHARSQRLAIAFAVPEIPKGQSHIHDALMNAWINQIKIVNCDSYAYVFPASVRNKAENEVGGYFYPGTAVFLKRLNQSTTLGA